MKLRTPSFWYPPLTPIDYILMGALLPFSLLYLVAHFVHQKTGKQWKAPVPVICVGNLTAGGGGKTPAVIALSALVKTHAIAANPFILTRGYGGDAQGPVLVDPAQHNAQSVGDEALLHSRHAPTIVAKDRRAGIELAVKLGADLILMDDGLQNPSVQKTLRMVVVDGKAGFGNRLPLPAGPLRTPLFHGMKNADCFIVLNGDFPMHVSVPVIRADVVPGDTLPARDAAYVAFSGLARPEKFLLTAKSLGLNITGWHPFPDHYYFSDTDLRRLQDEAREKGARLLTTEKDAVRLPQGFDADILPVRLAWHYESAVADIISRAVGHHS